MTGTTRPAMLAFLLFASTYLAGGGDLWLPFPEGSRLADTVAVHGDRVAYGLIRETDGQTATSLIQVDPEGRTESVLPGRVRPLRYSPEVVGDGSAAVFVYPDGTVERVAAGDHLTRDWVLALPPSWPTRVYALRERGPPAAVARYAAVHRHRSRRPRGPHLRRRGARRRRPGPERR